MQEEELNSLERVERRLYSADAPATFEEPVLRTGRAEETRGWEKLRRVPTTVRVEAEHIAGPARFFIVALLFFLLTAGGGIVYLIWGGRIVSTNNVNIAVQGPTTIASGDTVPLLLTFQNKNPVALQHATLTVIFPDGTKSPDDPTQPLTTYRTDLGTVDSGATISRTVRAVLYGSEGQHVALPIKLEYGTNNSNSVFVKNKQYDFIITSSPLELTVQALSQVSAGQSATVDVTVRSNATTPLQNVAVVATYPFGFTPTKTDPAPSTGTVFSLGTMNPGDEKHISITGVVSGQENDQRVFSFAAGTVANAGDNALAQSFTTKGATIALTKPFLATTLSVNSDTSDAPVVDAGAPVQVTVTWINTLPTPVANARVAVSLAGSGFDPASVVGSGFYRSTDQTMLFDSTSNPGLANLAPGDTGQGTFSFKTKGDMALGTNPSIALKVSVSGQRLSEKNVPETLTSTLTRTVKIGTNLGLASHIVRTTGPFPNTGPWPPTHDAESTYTVVYQLTNSGNAVAGTQVSAALPSYVRFTGKESPADGSITYDDATRTVTWKADDVASGAVKTVYFQIGVTPSITQVGSSPVLIFSQQVIATDRFTGHPIAGSVPQLTTQLSGDAGYTSAFGQVK